MMRNPLKSYSPSKKKRDDMCRKANHNLQKFKDLILVLADKSGLELPSIGVLDLCSVTGIQNVCRAAWIISEIPKNAMHVLFTSKGVTCLKQTAETKDQNGNMMHFKVQGMLRNCAWQPWDLVPA